MVRWPDIERGSSLPHTGKCVPSMCTHIYLSITLAYLKHYTKSSANSSFSNDVVDIFGKSNCRIKILCCTAQFRPTFVGSLYCLGSLREVVTFGKT